MLSHHSQPWSPRQLPPSHPILPPSSPKSQSVGTLRAQYSVPLFFWLQKKPENETGSRAEEKGGWVAGKGRKARLQPSATEDLDKVLPPRMGVSGNSHFSQKDRCLFYKQILWAFKIGQTEQARPVNSQSRDSSCLRFVFKGRQSTVVALESQVTTLGPSHKCAQRGTDISLTGLETNALFPCLKKKTTKTGRTTL